MKVCQRLEPALGNFCLVRCVGGVPARIFKDVAEDHRRRDAGLITLADEALFQGVASGEGPELRKGGVFTDGFWKG